MSRRTGLNSSTDLDVQYSAFCRINWPAKELAIKNEEYLFRDKIASTYPPSINSTLISRFTERQAWNGNLCNRFWQSGPSMGHHHILVAFFLSYYVAWSSNILATKKPLSNTSKVSIDESSSNLACWWKLLKDEENDSCKSFFSIPYSKSIRVSLFVQEWCDNSQHLIRHIWESRHQPLHFMCQT